MKSAAEKTKVQSGTCRDGQYDNSRGGLQDPAGTLSDEKKKRILEKARELYNQSGSKGEVPEVCFNLKGRAAGQWRMTGGQEQLRFNPQAFVLDWDAHFPATVAHEIAHSLVYRDHGPRGARPHGPEWQARMRAFGCEPRVTHDTPLSGRKMKTHDYACDCRHHLLSARRHHLIQRKHYRYQCRQCGATLRPGKNTRGAAD
ncbi:SprT-like domain-containing protein [Thioalkalivibrio sp. AKL10]|uniref:SprT family zinc-dependent metalloprotease n=1 Tax=Thioalkalivibrio sp. AKL10 TaxID=1158158 RepID=UPI0009D9CAD3|nr:SprT-like domain-containing protein [Thioalkalivibrio sp. AKL10]